MVVAIVALLIGLLVPALGTAKAQARQVVCASNLRQLATATIMYTNDARGALPPCGWWDSTQRGYWWGQILEDRVDHTASPLHRYLRSPLQEDSVFECPDQPWGTYDPQPQSLFEQVTSTYGYNGYYLTPAATPGWAGEISKRPWQRLETVLQPGSVFLFADTLMDMNPGGRPSNNALLDPPFLFRTSRGQKQWRANGFPTTVFRHRGRANAACLDGHVESFGLEGGQLTSPQHMIGYVGARNHPHYVPDWQDW